MQRRVNRICDGRQRLFGGIVALRNDLTPLRNNKALRPFETSAVVIAALMIVVR